MRRSNYASLSGAPTGSASSSSGSGDDSANATDVRALSKSKSASDDEGGEQFSPTWEWILYLVDHIPPTLGDKQYIKKLQLEATRAQYYATTMYAPIKED